MYDIGDGPLLLWNWNCHEKLGIHQEKPWGFGVWGLDTPLSFFPDKLNQMCASSQVLVDQSDKILVVPKRMKFTAIAKTVPAMTVSMVS